MALFDHRVFRVEDGWWAAQVHSASGAGYSTTPPITNERVYFSSLSDRSRKTVTATIRPGSLNRLSHRSLLRVFHTAEDFGDHFRMAAYNTPSLEELGQPIYTDDENLRWVVRPTETVRLSESGALATSEGVEFICLDDSALRKELLLTGGQSFGAFRSKLGELDLPAIVNGIKSTFLDYEPPTGDTF